MDPSSTTLSTRIDSLPPDDTLPGYLVANGIPTLVGADTRAVTRHIREAGASAAEELAFTLRDGLEYVKKSIERGLKWLAGKQR